MKLSLVILSMAAGALTAPLMKSNKRSDSDEVVGNLWHAKEDDKRSDSDEVVGNLWHAKDDSN
ncbi:hypothetical protein BDV95DRAFT_508465 [Massariosphaeria phaeospora]|uniref:Uncharacterized protein n=1 Tax=Massariosphaeria phaeospora TaxID=100035 RepID=A0A7C8M073_9PLEO|nr:hypothetical protein BDV95DRAFT_508465 [Massariosphaeria phaeospora]